MYNVCTLTWLLYINLCWQTGTLTQNIMTFLKCSIRGVKHGESAVTEEPMEQEVATGRISKAPSPAPDTKPAGATDTQVHVHVYLHACTIFVHTAKHHPASSST